MKPALVVSVLLSVLLPSVRAGPVTAPVTAEVWSVAVGAVRGSPVVAVHDTAGLLLVEDGDHGVTALAADDGRIAWFVQLAGTVDPPPAATDDRIALAVGAEVLVVEAETGRRLAAIAPAAAPAVAPVAGTHGVSVLHWLDDRYDVHDVASGRLAWTLRLPAPPAGSAVRPRPDAGVLVVPLTDGTLRALPLSSRPASERWTIGLDALHADPVAADGSIVLLDGDRRLTVVDGLTGTRRWRRVLGDRVIASPAAGRQLVVVATGERLLALEMATGLARWALEDAAEVPVGVASAWVLTRAADGSEVLRASADGRPLSRRLPPEGSRRVVGERLVEWNDRAVRSVAVRP